MVRTRKKIALTAKDVALIEKLVREENVSLRYAIMLAVSRFNEKHIKIIKEDFPEAYKRIENIRRVRQGWQPKL